MSDTISDGGQLQGIQAVAGGEVGGGAVTPREWMAGLPDDLKADATLARYETPEALARGHLEARRSLSSRIAVPGKDADDATRNAFYTAIGRPEKAEGYAFEVPDNDGARALAGKFGEIAYGLGMPKEMAEAVVKFNNEQRTGELEAYQASAKADYEGWRADKPDADARVARIGEMFKKFGVGEMDAAQIEARLGTKAMFEMFDKMATATTEHVRQDGDPGTGAVAQGGDADKAFSERLKDPKFVAAVGSNDPEAKAEYTRLVEAKRIQARDRAKAS